MSETDDTDVLLLIPPNFFLVHSSGSEDSLLESSRTVVHKPQSCTAQVLGKLVNQVHSLESRLESLEITTTITDSSVSTLTRPKNWDTDSFDSRSLDRKCFTFPRRRRRKVSKRENTSDLSLNSLDSFSTRRTVPPLKLKDFDIASIVTKPTETNDSPSMDGDISSIVSSPSKKNDNLLLHEIDEFLTKVDDYEGPESKYKECKTSLSPDNVIKATGDYLTQKLDSKSSSDEVRLPSGRTVSSDVLDKYIYLVKNHPGKTLQNEKPGLSNNTYKHQYNEESCLNRPSETRKASENFKNVSESRSPSIRKLNFSNKDVQPTSTPKRHQASSYLDSFKPSSNKIYDRASKVLEEYKSQSCSRNNLNSVSDASYLLAKEDFKMPQMRPYVSENREVMKLASMQNKLMDSIDTDLLSLSELWGEKGDKVEKGESNKLEEERLKREHCEAMIQQLQKKILEQQEKLAVAVKVDRAKDAAISKLREAWLRLTSSLDRAEERHRAALEKMVREVENFKMVADEAQKRTNHFEAELYKALDLAHDYQEKCKQLTSDSKQLQDSTAKALLEKDSVVNGKAKEIDVLKENYETVMRLNKQSTDCVKSLEDALEKERSEHALTKTKVNDLNSKIQSMADETSLVRQERDLLKDKVNEERARGGVLERQLSEKQNQTSELLKKCDMLDTEVKNLRKHLELQKNELKIHYQKQLEDAVLAKLQEFQQQLDLAEREMEHAARGKENAIVDTYNKQMARIEEQHKLEVSLLEEKQREEIKLYRLQLAQSSEKIGLLENKLETYRRRRGQIASQLHSVMESQWRQALLILTNGNPASKLDLTRDSVASTPVAQDYAPPKVPPLTMPSFAEKALLRDERSADNMFNFEGLSDNELQQYVKLLLTKPATMDGSGDSAPSQHRELLEEPTSDRPDRREKSAKRSLNTSKPPWKA